MFNVYYHHDLGILADHLIDTLIHREHSNPLAPDTIIVPNRETARWFTLRYTDRTGIAANLEWVLPSEWTWSLIRQIHPDLQLLMASDREPIKWRLYSLFSQKKIRERFPVVESYLEGRETDAGDSYRWQLAEKIASAFDQYQVYRPDMLLRWERGKVGPREEKWQAELWNLLVLQWKKQGEARFQKHRAGYFLELIEHIRAGKLRGSDPLCLFNPGRLTEPFLELITAYAASNELDLYSVTAGPDGSPDTAHSEILGSFGNEMSSFRSLIRNFVNPEQIHHLPQTAPPPGYPESNLGRIKSSIVSDTAFPDLEKNDGSVVIHSCHNRLREVETLRDSLLELFSVQSDHSSLKPVDVLVVAPDLREYKPLIDAVFSVKERGIPQIPYHIALPESSAGGGYTRALLHLLELPSSRLNLEEVMEFMNHQPVRESFRFTDADIGTIRRWFEENRVIWGFDSRHRSFFNQPETGINTWTSALQRGWIGHLAGGDPGELIEDELPYSGIDNTDHQLLWAKVQKLLNLLHETILDSRQKRQCRQWSELLQRRARTLFGREQADNAGLKDLLISIGSLESEAEAADFNEAVPFDIIRQRLISLFEDQRTGSVFFTRGVIFSRMVPVRSIPFRMIACLGLNNDQFPRRGAENPVDLIEKYPKQGERNRKSVDRNLFLESVLAAGQIHWCSYTGRSQQDNESIPPAPILEVWIRLLNSSLPDSTSSVVKQESLHGFSMTNFSPPGGGLSEHYLNAAEVILSDSGEKGFYKGGTLPDPETEEPVTLTDLEMFYRHPLKNFCNRRLNIYLDERETTGNEIEFQASHLDRHLLFQSLLSLKLNGMADSEAETIITRSGYLPEGWPGKKALNDLQQSVKFALEELAVLDISIESTLHDLNPSLHESGLTGSVLSLSKQCLLELNPSRCNGKHLLAVWIKHLALSCLGSMSSDRSLMLFGLRDNEPVWKHFEAVSHPEEYLSELLSHFRRGLNGPLPLFPETAFVYIDAIKKGAGEDAALEKAMHSEWSRVNYKSKRRFGNQADLYTGFLYGEEADLSGQALKEFPQTAEALFSPLIDHLSEGF